ncbi:hypothetical protein Ctob_002294 [Chrysochromulina tobinii]|uniref:Protein nlrc3 n=1 Tax=Chrysochromulina tobinii TaxID=1460289 RepID=A0A0M0JLU4_9EUKA|nr:hypothetical protein Ctob_002294 [Chrysochromulina tobinii]|eukprot:KOO27307.1 hypothetical protein Ctob_002294 [Chrysochromulina sp. CCMP291]
MSQGRIQLDRLDGQRLLLSDRPQASSAQPHARPEDPFTFVALRLCETGLEHGEQAQADRNNAQSERSAQVPDLILPLREKAAKVLAPIKQSAAIDDGGDDAHGDDHAVKLPEALRHFLPLAKTKAIEVACGPLHELELAVARDPDSKEAVDALRAHLDVLMKVTAAAIAERTEDMDEKAAKELIKACETAITAGNKDFLGVYQNVFNVILSGDADGMAKYDEAVVVLDAAIKKPAVAEQRDEAGDAAVLFADAARMKPSFDDVVREVASATGAGLELAVLSTKEDATRASDGGAGQGGARKARTGLKKTSRVIEKSALRPGEGRGLSKCVCDVVRAMLVATSMSMVASIVRALWALHEADMIQVVRIKNRFRQPSAGGWRDLMVNFVIVGDATRHVCEVQVVHQMMLTARKGLPGHAIYGIVRNAMELIESCGREHELRREAVRVMVEEGKTDAELIGAFEDAWVLADPEWAEGVKGGRDALVRKAIKVDREEGRLNGLVLSKIWMKEALPASVLRLTALRELHLEDCTLLNLSLFGEALKAHHSLTKVYLDGIALPVKLLRGTDPVETLDLSGKQLRSEHAVVIACLIGVNGALTVTNLLGNRLDAESAKMLADVAKQKGISLCGIRRDQIKTDYSWKKLKPPDAILLASDLSQAVVTGALTSINLSYNQLCGIWTDDYGDEQGTYTAKGITAIAHAMRVNGALTKCDLRGNDMGEEGNASIRDAVQGKTGFMLHL